MLLNITNYSAEPIHSQIVNQILLRILEEDKLPGDELESIGKISRQHHIGKASIKKAFQKLHQLGVVCVDQNEKYYINDISTRAVRLLIERNYNSNQSFSEYELYKTELNAARQIQNDLLPKNLPSNKVIDVSAYSTISEDVGGDFYDFFELGAEKYGVVIGDASGKGFSAAMLISQIQAIIKSDLSSNRTLLQTINLINSYMNTYSSARNFATLFYGVLDLNLGLLDYVNAGHNFPMIIDKNGCVKRLKTTGPAVGIVNNAEFKEAKTTLSNKDLMFLFTDGLSERMNKADQQFGEGSILKKLIQFQDYNSKTIIDEINSSLAEFAGNKLEEDDTTFIVMKIGSLKKRNS